MALLYDFLLSLVIVQEQLVFWAEGTQGSSLKDSLAKSAAVFLSSLGFEAIAQQMLE